jgi:hypothetical protein
MGTMATIPGAAGGAVTGQKNIGLPVLGGKFGTNGSSPIAGIGVTGAPGAKAITPGASPGSTGAIPGAPLRPIMTQPSAAAPGSTALPVAAPGAPNNGNPVSSTAPGVPANLSKQLTDIYGKGEGGLIGSIIGNLGSNDSSYIQAYQTALAKQSSMDLSTIGTTLSNAGISADSSTSAIEKSNYQSGVAAQVGIQEQQLINQQQQQLIGVTTGMQGAAAAQTATSWLDTVGQVANIAGDFVGSATGLSSLGKGLGSAAKSIGGWLGGGAGGSVPGATSGEVMA